MRFSFAIVLAVAGAAIEARPNSESTEADKVSLTCDTKCSKVKAHDTNLFVRSTQVLTRTSRPEV
jgi:hypothetical protein